MQKYQNSVQDKHGNAIKGASVVVTVVGGGTPILFSDNGFTALDQPLKTDSLGFFAFYAADGRYNISISKPGITTINLTDILLEDAGDGIPALAAPNGSSLVAHRADGVGAVVRTVQDKLRETVSVKDFGAVGDGIADDTAAIQRAIDSVHSNGGGTVYLPDGAYFISASSLAESYDNAGVAVAANLCGIVLRKRVSLIGSGASRCKITSTNKTLILLAMIAPEQSSVSGMEIDGAWQLGDAGAGHGIFVLSTAGGADTACKGVSLSDLHIKNIASYGIGLQSGAPENCRIDSVTVENSGADAFDLKARSDLSTEPSGNSCTNVTVRNHGSRITGSAGVDVRGIWHLANVTVTDFGGDVTKDYFGIRFRTKPPVGDQYNKAGARSTLTGFYVRPATAALALALYGVVSGSDDVHISNGVTDGCTEGITLTGNVNGNAQRNTVSNVTALNSSAYGFRIGNGVLNTALNGCITMGSTTAGFRNEATGTTFIGCSSVSDTAAKSTAAGSVTSEVCVGSMFGNEYGVSMNSAAVGRVNIDAIGPSANIDIHFSPKGTGVMRFGAHTTASDAPVAGYILIRDSAGGLRKLAVIA